MQRRLPQDDRRPHGEADRRDLGVAEQPRPADGGVEVEDLEVAERGLAPTESVATEVDTRDDAAVAHENVARPRGSPGSRATP